MNSYYKYAPNVWLAKCEKSYDKGEVILVANRYGDEKEHIVHNLIASKGGFNYYSIVRADGFDAQKRAAAKEAKLLNAAGNAAAKSHAAWQASHEGADFLALGEPIKVGHHSERRHRALIERNHRRMEKMIEHADAGAEYERRAAYWAAKAKDINLSMPESLDYYAFELEKAKAKHVEYLENPEKRPHSLALSYAKKKVNEVEKLLEMGKKLWG